MGRPDQLRPPINKFLRMNVATFEGIVENGQIRLPDNIRVPERTKVYVVIPGAGLPSAARLMSPHLAHPERPRSSR